MITFEECYNSRATHSISHGNVCWSLSLMINILIRKFAQCRNLSVNEIPFFAPCTNLSHDIFQLEVVNDLGG